MCCRDEAENLAKKLRLRFYRTSVKENLNVDEGLNMLGSLSHQLCWFAIDVKHTHHCFEMTVSDQLHGNQNVTRQDNRMKKHWNEEILE